MNPFRSLAFAVLTLVAASPALADPAPRKILFFTQSAGYEHSVIQRRAGNPSFAEQVLAEWGPPHALEFVFSKDGSLFSPEYLARFDGFVFYTNGDLTQPSRDGSPSMSPAGKAALLDAIRAGKGFVGIHSAAGTFRSGSRPEVDPFIRMLGGEFIKHGRQQTTILTAPNPRFPGFELLPSPYGPHEEWYAFRNFSEDLHVLLMLHPFGMVGDCYERPPYPLAWARLHGEGRVFYTGLGHREDVWLSAEFKAMLLGGIDWATRRVDTEVPATFPVLTPQGNVLPVPKPPAP